MYIPSRETPFGERAKRTNKDGFTFLEILVSLVLLSVLASVLVFGVFRAQNLFGLITDRAISGVKLLQLDTSVRSLAANVRIPFWMDTVEINQKETLLAIPYLDGDPTQYLIFETRSEHLYTRIEKREPYLTEPHLWRRWIGEELSKPSSRAERSFGPFTDIRFELAVDEESRMLGVGLYVTLLDKDDREVFILARFGSIQHR